MRLLFVSHSFPPADRPMASIGGMQRVAVELSESLDAHTSVTRIVLHSAWRWHHIQCALWLVPTFARIRSKARRREIDAVLFSSMVTGALGLLLRHTLAKHDIPMAAIAHGKDVTQKGPYQWFLVRRILQVLDAVLPVSRATGAACMARGMPEARVHIIPNGVSAARFQPVARERSPREVLLLCSVGRLVRRKGFAWFVRHVMPRLPANVHYHIGGAGPERARIAAVIRECGLGDRVRLLGRLSEEGLLHLYDKARLLIVPNIPVPGDMEGFGIVMLEAGACGVPAVASRLEGIQDVITEGVNGHLVVSRDAKGFAAAVARYVDNPAAWQALSSQTRQHTLAAFRWNTIAARYVHALEDLRKQKTSDRYATDSAANPG